MRSNFFPSVTGDILSTRNYVDRLSTHFNLKIQSDHFGNGKSLSIEGCNIEFIDEDLNAQSKFYFHLSDDSQQDASTTHTYMVSMLNELGKGKHPNPKYTILESTNCFFK